MFFWLTVIWRYLYASLDAHPEPFYARFITLLLWAFSSSCLWKVKAREKSWGKPQHFEERKNITEKPQKSTFKYLYNNIKAKEEAGRRLKMLPVKPDKNSQKKNKALDVKFWGKSKWKWKMIRINWRKAIEENLLPVGKLYKMKIN